jgi:hypothetical protein
LPADLFAKITDLPRKAGIKGEKIENLAIAVKDVRHENTIQRVLKMKLSALGMSSKS